MCHYEIRLRYKLTLALSVGTEANLKSVRPFEGFEVDKHQLDVVSVET